jgi:tRNA(Ile)-lysidine synthetase-like protein
LAGSSEDGRPGDGQSGVGRVVTADDSADVEVVRQVRAAVAASLERNWLARGRRRIIVAVSGGADSLCLLDAMAGVVAGAGRRLTVGHVDHQLRSESAEDAAHVEAAAKTLGLACEILTVDVPAIAAAERRGIEEAARLGRYRALGTLAESHGRAVVVTGHTADDTAETVLLHLLRGTGRNGLAGISEHEHLSSAALGTPVQEEYALTLVRPLLSVSRAETVAYCEARGIRWRTDETNSDARMMRNRVRAHLLPVLRTYNPAVDRALTRMAAAVTDDEAWLGTLVEKLWHRLAQPCDDGTVSVALTAWQRQPLAAQRRLVRQFAEQVGYWAIGFEAVERALQVADEDDGPPRAELGAGVIVERRGGMLHFSAPPRTLGNTEGGHNDGA